MMNENEIKVFYVRDEIVNFATGIYKVNINTNTIIKNADEIPEDELEDYEDTSIYTYFMKNDIFDIEYHINSEFDYRGATIMIACGGPNIYINTRTKQIELYWANEEAFAYIPSEVVDEIDSYFEELYISDRECNR